MSTDQQLMIIKEIMFSIINVCTTIYRKTANSDKTCVVVQLFSLYSIVFVLKVYANKTKNSKPSSYYLVMRLMT